MSSRWHHSNGLTTAAGEERIRGILNSREEILERINNQITAEENRGTSCENAIFNLEAAILDGKKIFKIHEESLMALETMKNHLFGLPGLVSWNTRPEDTSETLCDELKICATRPTAQKNEVIEKLMSLFEEETRPLWEKIGQLKMELEGWKLILKASTLMLENLKIRRDVIKNEILVTSQPFRPIWKIPTDTWAAIFRLVREEELRDYIKQNDMKSLRSIVFVLSHVCRSWRSIVSGEPSLWNLVYAPPVTAWRQDEYDLLTSSTQKCNGSLTLLTNAYQAFPRGYHPVNRLEKNINTSASVVTPNENIVFPERKYTLHINTRDGQQLYMQRMSNIPFKQPSAIILSATYPFSQGYFFGYTTCSNVKSFTITNSSIEPFNLALVTTTLASFMPQLTILRLQVKELPAAFSLAGWFLPNLEELYLYHERGGVFPTWAALPKLCILGITSASTQMIQYASMPELKTLIMYGSSNANQAVEISAGSNADQVYRRLVHLRLEDWGKVDVGIATAGAVSMAEKVVSKTAGLHTIEFLDSFLDGEALVRTVTGATQGTGVGKLRYLTEITLNGVSGITRDQCDQIKDMVTKLNIYV